MKLANDILRVQNLKKYFPIRGGLFQKQIGEVKAVDDISFLIQGGEIFGLIGESGSGKTTVGKTLLGIYRPTQGRIWFKGKDILDPRVNHSRWFKSEMQIVFQNPTSALNPRRSVKQILEVPLRVHLIVKNGNYEGKIVELLEMVELPAEYMAKYPHALSGGEKQRVSLTRALAVNPSFIILDEPTSALDVSVQGKIITLLLKLRGDLGLTYLFISHDLGLVRNVAARTAVMYLGKICEVGRTQELFYNPLHPYTRMLLSAIPVVSEEEEKMRPAKVEVKGEIASPVNVPKGCNFHPRCNYEMNICRKKVPMMVEVHEDHLVSCHLFKGNYVGIHRYGWFSRSCKRRTL